MSDSTIRRRYRIAAGLSAEFCYDPARSLSTAMQVHWEPDRPKSLRGAAWRRYRNARADFALLVHQQIGQRLVVIDGIGLSDEQAAELQLAMTEPAGSA